MTVAVEAPMAAAAARVEARLDGYRSLVIERLIDLLPRDSPANIYDLLAEYPSRPGKALRPALCMAVCGALGGDPMRALSAAVAIELFHNSFLILDDIQDESELRRGLPTMSAEHGVAIALNVGNATSLVGFQCLMGERSSLGSWTAWRVMQETELMMRQSLEGQAMELRWIRENACELRPDDYYRMCLKKTSWYTCIYPCRVGALIARQSGRSIERFDRYGWFLGAAFQIQDDLLNLTGDVSVYGKEIAGDLWEGKRTLMLIDLLDRSGPEDRRRLTEFLSRSRAERSADEVEWARRRMVELGCIERARSDAQALAMEARDLVADLFGDEGQSDEQQFVLDLPAYVVARQR